MKWALYETIYRGEVSVPTVLTLGLTESESHSVLTEWLDAHDSWPHADEVVGHEFQPQESDDDEELISLNEVRQELAKLRTEWNHIQRTADTINLKQAALERWLANYPEK